MKILWLASWYPSDLFPFDGDFIQRHARAVSLFCDIEVIYVVKDAEGLYTRDIQETTTHNNRLTERIIYYKPLQTSFGLFNRILSTLKYQRVYKKAVNNYVAQNGRPRLVHLQIAMKAGLTALWIKKKYKIPYILSEQWTGYLDNANPTINDFNFIYQYYWSKIIKQAAISTYVSEVLKNRLVHLYKINNTFVIPNVVDTRLFFPKQQEAADGQLQLIHISTMVYQKNTEGILEALRILKNDCRFTLQLYGTINPALEQLIKELELQNYVFVKGEVSHDQLSKAIQQADALILYSRFETFGCVLIEANACGVPVIVSDLEVFHEIVQDGVNGIFVTGENPRALAEKIKQFAKQKDNFDRNSIARATAAKYSYERVGQQFADLYTIIDNQNKNNE